MKTNPHLGEEARRRRVWLAPLAAAALVTAAALVLQARYLALTIDGAFLRGWSLERAAVPLAAFGIASLVRAIGTWAGQATGAHLASLVKGDLRRRLTRHLVRLGPGYVASRPSGGLLAAAGEGIDRLDAWFGLYLPQLVQTALIPVAILAVAVARDGLTALVFLCTAPLIPLFIVLIGRLAEGRAVRQWRQLGRLSDHFLDVLQGLATLKALGRSRGQAADLARTADDFRGATMEVLRLAFLSSLVLELLATLSTAIVAVEIGLRLLHDHLSFVDALWLLILAPEFYQPFRQLGARYHAAMEGVTAAGEIFAILESPAATRTGGGPPGDPAPICFEAVTYTYPDRGRPAVEGVTLTLEAGRTVALVGPTGSGKTTLASLLLRFAEPDQGAIRVGGQVLAQIDPNDWRALLAWVPQHPRLFNTSVLDNILLSRPGARQQQVRQAARRAHFDEVVEALPEGYQTVLGEGGARLSGGEAQRLALARAFLRDAPVLILDEPAAQLDARSAAAVGEGMAQLRQGRTTLLIAHRLAAVERADAVAVLVGGRLQQVGTHADLAGHPGPYARMVEAHRAAPV